MPRVHRGYDYVRQCVPNIYPTSSKVAVLSPIITCYHKVFTLSHQHSPNVTQSHQINIWHQKNFKTFKNLMASDLGKSWPTLAWTDVILTLFISMFPPTSGIFATIEFNVTNHHAFSPNHSNMTTSGEYTLQSAITFSLSVKLDVKSVDKTFQMR